MFLYGKYQGATAATAQHKVYIMQHNATRNNLYTYSRTQLSPQHEKQKNTCPSCRAPPARFRLTMPIRANRSKTRGHRQFHLPTYCAFWLRHSQPLRKRAQTQPTKQESPKSFLGQSSQGWVRKMVPAPPPAEVVLPGALVVVAVVVVDPVLMREALKLICSIACILAVEDSGGAVELLLAPASPTASSKPPSSSSSPAPTAFRVATHLIKNPLFFCLFLGVSPPSTPRSSGPPIPLDGLPARTSSAMSAWNSFYTPREECGATKSFTSRQATRGLWCVR